MFHVQLYLHIVCTMSNSKKINQKSCSCLLLKEELIICLCVNLCISFTHGVCTDASSHTLVYDLLSLKVRMWSQDEEFLKYPLTVQSQRIEDYFPRCLSYNLYNHCLWVESGPTLEIDQLSVFRHTFIDNQLFRVKLICQMHTCQKVTFD